MDQPADKRPRQPNDLDRARERRRQRERDRTEDLVEKLRRWATGDWPPLDEEIRQPS